MLDHYMNINTTTTQVYILKQREGTSEHESKIFAPKKWTIPMYKIYLNSHTIQTLRGSEDWDKLSSSI